MNKTLNYAIIVCEFSKMIWLWICLGFKYQQEIYTKDIFTVSEVDKLESFGNAMISINFIILILYLGFLIFIVQQSIMKERSLDKMDEEEEGNSVDITL